MIKAIVIDDSAYNRVTLAKMLESSGEVQVVATAINGEDGIKQVLRYRPDVITLDLEMPVMDGFAFLRWLMANLPRPVIAVSSRASDRSVFKALELGAVDFIAKPGGRVSPRLEEIGEELLSKVRQCAEIRLENVQKRIHEEEPPRARSDRMVSGRAKNIDLVVIGASTGGPPALQSLFQQTPLIPVPFVVAQHMPQTFTRVFAERMNRLASYRVKEAEDGEPLVTGWVYIAPGGSQTEIVRSGEDLRIRVSEKSVSDLYAPSVNRLFSSAVESCADRVLAIVLTGMGDDGADSIRRIREAGGRTIAEAASTAIIFGMPGEAIRTGAVEEVLPVGEIPGAIHRICMG
ncbi:MAG: chemotaxis-specific protein-glutamate methyltransferase CheB [Thermoanaerobaculia bacterium]